MKNTIKITIILFLLGGSALSAQEGRDRFMIQVDGLGCPFCAYGLEKKFKELKGIKHVKINIETGDFSFSYPSEKGLSMEAAKEQVRKAGYSPITARIERADGKIEEYKPEESK